MLKYLQRLQLRSVKAKIHFLNFEAPINLSMIQNTQNIFNNYEKYSKQLTSWNKFAIVNLDTSF